MKCTQIILSLLIVLSATFISAENSATTKTASLISSTTIENENASTTTKTTPFLRESREPCTDTQPTYCKNASERAPEQFWNLCQKSERVKKRCCATCGRFLTMTNFHDLMIDDEILGNNPE